MTEQYSLGDAVLCAQGQLLYEAKIQDIKKDKGVILYGVHYKGWNKSWDEYVRGNVVSESAAKLIRSLMLKTIAATGMPQDDNTTNDEGFPPSQRQSKRTCFRSLETR